MSHAPKPRFPLTAIHGLNNSELAGRTGYALRTIQRWSTNGIPFYSADRLAIRLGVHPSTLVELVHQLNGSGGFKELRRNNALRP
jgi:hypothetical protein